MCCCRRSGLRPKCRQAAHLDRANCSNRVLTVFLPRSASVECNEPAILLRSARLFASPKAYSLAVCARFYRPLFFLACEAWPSDKGSTTLGKDGFAYVPPTSCPTSCLE